MSTQTNDGGPIMAGMESDNQGRLIPVGGLSIRDWFAGMAIQSSSCYINQHETRYADSLADNAKTAYDIADAMIAARNGGQP